MKRLATWVLFAVAFFYLVGGSSSAATFDVTIRDFEFVPSTLTINVGDTVRWTNNGSSSHTSTSGANCSADSIWASPVLGTNQTFSFTFTSPGTFAYFCSVDSHCVSFDMQAIIFVNDTTAVLPAPSSQQFLDYFPITDPIVAGEFSAARPIGIGSFATGGPELLVKVQTAAFNGPVTVYLALTADFLQNEIFLFTSGNVFVASSQAGLVPWIPNTTGPIDSAPFGQTGIPISLLPSGTYDVYLAVVPVNQPQGQFFYYIWKTFFIVPIT